MTSPLPRFQFDYAALEQAAARVQVVSHLLQAALDATDEAHEHITHLAFDLDVPQAMAYSRHILADRLAVANRLLASLRSTARDLFRAEEDDQ